MYSHAVDAEMIGARRMAVNGMNAWKKTARLIVRICTIW
jgi:hypothetical protein